LSASLQRAVMMVIPVYIYDNEELHDLVIFGELLAVAAIIMCLAFVTVDLGRPTALASDSRRRPIQFPASMLSWDVVVLNGLPPPQRLYLRLSALLPLPEQRPAKWFYIPFVFIAIVWAVSIHTVTAFLYVGLGRADILEFFHRRPTFPRVSIHRWPGTDHSGDTSCSPRHASRVRKRSRPKMCRNCEGRPATLDDLAILGEHLPELASVSTQARNEILAEAVVIEANAGDVLLRQGETD
jgi:hypothetical protein